MAVTYGFFNSVNGDRKYNAEQMSEYFRGIINEGVYQHLDGGLAVTAGTGLAVNVAAGRAIIQNRWVQNSAAMSLTIAAASETYARKDAVVIRLNWSSRSISIAVKTGTPAASPVAPSMTRNSTTYEMALAYVNVAANATSVTVTDKRSDSTVCGWVTVAQSTSGEVDAQLNAMKTGFDGVVYNSPAAQVIGSDTKLQAEITKSLVAVEDVIDQDSLLFDDVKSSWMMGFITASGLRSSTTGWIMSKYYLVKEMYNVYYKAYGHPNVSSVAFYDETMTFISGVIANAEGDLIEGFATIPSGAVYVAFTFRNNNVAANSDQYVTLYTVNNTNFSAVNVVDALEVTAADVESTWSNGFIKTNGTVQTDSNWMYSPYLSAENVARIKYAVPNHTDIAALSWYDDSFTMIGYIPGTITNNAYLLVGEKQFPAGAKYFRIVFAKASFTGFICYPAQMFIASTIKLPAAADEEDYPTRVIHPTVVYTTANDLNVERNHSASFYLDHFYNLITKEYDLRFDNNKIKKSFASPIKITSPNLDNPTIVYNGGNNTQETTKSIGIKMNGATKESFSVKHRSVLNSITANASPKVLCIGDSITWGEGAFPLQDKTRNDVYWISCAEMFKKDNVDNSGSGFSIQFLGTANRRTKTFEYKGTSYTVEGNCEGYRGWNFPNFYAAGSKFYNDSTGKFSINKWLAGYRTMNDSGERLTLGDGTGTEITAANLNVYDVCTPTIVTIMLGANGGGSVAQYQKIVSDIREEYPNIPIALFLSDTAGTYFPSLHPDVPDEMLFWNSTAETDQGETNRHTTMFNSMKNIIDTFNTAEYEADNVFILPCYFIQPTVESGEMRDIPEPSVEFSFTEEDSHQYYKYGWCPTVHVNSSAHVNFAYQLYSWIKWMIAKSL